MGLGGVEKLYDSTGTYTHVLRERFQQLQERKRTRKIFVEVIVALRQMFAQGRVETTGLTPNSPVFVCRDFCAKVQEDQGDGGQCHSTHKQQRLYKKRR